VVLVGRSPPKASFGGEAPSTPWNCWCSLSLSVPYQGRHQSFHSLCNLNLVFAGHYIRITYSTVPDKAQGRRRRKRRRRAHDCHNLLWDGGRLPLYSGNSCQNTAEAPPAKVQRVSFVPNSRNDRSLSLIISFTNSQSISFAMAQAPRSPSRFTLHGGQEKSGHGHATNRAYCPRAESRISKGLSPLAVSGWRNVGLGSRSGDPKMDPPNVTQWLQFPFDNFLRSPRPNLSGSRITPSGSSETAGGP
jgi:hypothetical protein